METRSVLWDVLGTINRINPPPDSREVRHEAFSYWQRRGCPENDDQRDWFLAQREIAANADLAKIGNTMLRAQERNDTRLLVGLAVVCNAAVVLKMRPTEIRADTALGHLDQESLARIVNGASWDLKLGFPGKVEGVRSIADLIDRFWLNGYGTRREGMA